MTVESALVRATGASGAPFAVWLPKTLVENDVFVEVCASEMGGLSISKFAEAYGVKRYAPDDHFTPPVSGTSVPDVIPVALTSVSALGNLANGTGQTFCIGLLRWR